jgi:hypothetical protein
MTNSLRIVPVLTIAFAALTFLPLEAHAYIGPGVGITAIGSLIALVGAVVLAALGFVWYPIKRLMATFSGRRSTRREAQKASHV